MNFWMMVVGAVVFAFFSAASWTLLQRWWPDAGVQRLAPVQSQAPITAPQWTLRLPAGLMRLLGWLSRWSLAEAAASAGTATGADATPSATTALGLKLLRAGWRSRQVMWVYGGSKTVLLLAFPALLASVAWTLGLQSGSLAWWTALLGAATLGFFLPDMVLRWRMAWRQRALFRAFPDALDLLRICVQAGLGLDAAIERVGREMRLASPVLSEEWRLTGLELRAGASRALALRHLADRVGLPDIDALVTMLIQADRFGTRMADALQVHADALRTQRRLKAEEAAAKLPVKLLIPLVFCIFPALLTVMLGPVGISLYHHFSNG